MVISKAAFFVSDRTAITAEIMGRSILTQFASINFEQVAIPFVDSPQKAKEVVERIDNVAQSSGQRPVVFSTLLDPEIRDLVANANAFFLDCFQCFISPLEEELGVKASRQAGLSHGLSDPFEYHQRMESVNFTMAHDDGAYTKELPFADVVLMGVSRCGKTPTCLYMALQFGIRAANYPLVPEDLDGGKLPTVLRSLKGKIYGLTINPERLHQIRSERKPGSSYARIETCRREVEQAECLMREEGITYLDTSTKSIEEIATTILEGGGLVRHIY